MENAKSLHFAIDKLLDDMYDEIQGRKAMSMEHKNDCHYAVAEIDKKMKEISEILQKYS